jgi:hypothetical protein
MLLTITIIPLAWFIRILFTRWTDNVQNVNWKFLKYYKNSSLLKSYKIPVIVAICFCFLNTEQTERQSQRKEMEMLGKCMK